MRTPRWVAALAAAMPLITLSATPTSAEPPPPSLYLALGDSVAAGVGAQPASNGYVFELYDRLVTSRRCGEGGALGCRLDLDNLAISGATTDTLLGQLPQVVQLVEDRNGDATPVDDVDLITLDIGGNDVFRPIITACSGTPQSPGCLATIQTTLTHVAANYRLILGDLRAAAGPDTPIAVMTYYNPLPGCRLAALAPLADLVLEGGPQVPVGLNDIIRAQAATVGAVVAETGPLISVADLAGDCLHPDNSGHEKIADAFQAVLDVDTIVGPPAD